MISEKTLLYTCVVATLVHSTLVGMGLFFTQRKALQVEALMLEIQCPSGSFLYKDEALYLFDLIDEGTVEASGLERQSIEGPSLCAICPEGYSCVDNIKSECPLN
jgi:hypothetical protein